MSARMHQCTSKPACEHKDRGDRLEARARQAHSNGRAMAFEDGEYQQCSEGYGGVLCGACTSSYGKVRTGECIRCGDRSKNIALACLCALWYALLVFLVAKSASPARGQNGELGPVGGAPRRTARGNQDTRAGYLDCHVETSSSSVGMPTCVQADSFGGISTSTEQGYGQPEKSVEKINEALPAGRRNYAGDIFKILINFLQVTSIAVYINIDWTNSILNALGLADILASGSEGLFSLECIFPYTSAHHSVLRTILSLTAPLAITLSLLLLSAFLGWLRSTDVSQFQLAIVPAAFYVSYIDVTRNALRVLDCVDIDERIEVSSGGASVFSSYWTEDTNVECYKGIHLYLTTTLAVPFLLSVTLGTPVLLLIVQSRRRNRRGVDSHEGSTVGTYGFLHRSYRNDCQYWEVAVMTRKGILAALTVFRLSLGSGLQASLALGVLGLALGAHAVRRPFVEDGPHLNRMEAVSLACSVGAFFSAVLLNDPHMSEVGAMLISVGFISCFVGVCGWLVVTLVREVVKGFGAALDNKNRRCGGGGRVAERAGSKSFTTLR
eukprot:evm.model.scf_365.3 EVM.evm.TU.scf_365.3   scf_365:55409-58423(-)